jgi:hypothetical protein
MATPSTNTRPQKTRTLMLMDERDRESDVPKHRPTAENDGTFDELADVDELGDSEDLGVAPPPDKDDDEVNEDGGPSRAPESEEHDS